MSDEEDENLPDYANEEAAAAENDGDAEDAAAARRKVWRARFCS